MDRMRLTDDIVPQNPQAAALPSEARDGARTLRQSKIREVANAGMGRAGVLPFWFGEPDEVTPQFIFE